MLAILIPYYKINAFKETLVSLVNQTDKNFKVYIGDDASPENPEQLLQEYRGKLSIKYARFTENLGGASLVEHWDRCVAMTENEEWIMILGDDDFLGANVVETFYNNLNVFRNKANVVRFASQMIYDKDNSVSEVYKHPVWEKAKDSFYRKHKGLTRSSLSEHVFLKRQYMKYKFYNYPLAWFSDDRAWLEFSEKLPVYTMNDAKVYIRVSPESISGKHDNLELKRISSSMFYNYLVRQKLDDFTKVESIEIAKGYLERALAIRKVTAKEWLFLWCFHTKRFSKPSFKKFSKTFLKYIFKKNRYYH